MAVVTVGKYFPCAKAPFNDQSGQHRVWSEYNITNIFNAMFDIPVGTPIISADRTKMLLSGYIFETTDGNTFTIGTNYYILVKDDELFCTDNDGYVLYADTQPSRAGYTAIGGKSQTMKFDQWSILDIDLNNPTTRPL